MAGIGWVVGIENVGTGVAVVLEVGVVDGGGMAGLEKKFGTVVLAVVFVGSGFGVGTRGVGVAGLAKKFGTAGCAGAGTVIEGVGAGAGVANKSFAGPLASVVAVVDFGCAGTVETGMDKLGVAVAVVGTGVGDGEGFFSSFTTFFVS